VFIPKQKQISRCGSGRAQELQRWFSAVFVFVLLVSAAGQDAGGNAGTNQPGARIVSTNPAPTQNIETPSLPPSVIEQLQEQSPLTNQIGVTPSQPPALGPATLGAAPPTAAIMGTSTLSGPPSTFGAGKAGPGIPLWGPINIHPHLVYTFTYGNGIDAQPGKQGNTAINTVTPGVLINVGKQWSLDYSPTFSYYSSPGFNNTMDEAVTLRGNWTSENWVFGLSQSYSSSSQPLIETGIQTEQEAYATALTASYQMGSELSLQLGLNQNFRDAEGDVQASTNVPPLTDLHEWTGNGWLDYQAGKMFGMAMGLILGYDKVDPGSDMPYEQLQGKINFHPGPKLTLTLSGGVEDRQFTGPSAPSLISPIFNGSLQYQIFQPTTIIINASRTTTPSFLTNAEVQVSTSFSGSIRQQLSKKLSLEGDASYSTTPYTGIETAMVGFHFGNAPALQVVRNDTTTSYRISLAYNIVERASLSIFYSLSDNTSSQSGFGYSSRQIGLSLSYQY